jgi:hypothetical protein
MSFRDLIEVPVKDVISDDIIFDVMGDAGSGEVYNLLLETGDDFLLENGGYILLE